MSPLSTQKIWHHLDVYAKSYGINANSIKFDLGFHVKKCQITAQVAPHDV